MHDRYQRWYGNTKLCINFYSSQSLRDSLFIRLNQDKEMFVGTYRMGDERRAGYGCHDASA